MGRVIWVLGLSGLVSCSEVLPFERPNKDIGGGGDAAVLEAGSDGPANDAPAADGSVDAASADLGPDTWPRFDTNSPQCNTLWVQPNPILVSSTTLAPASSPSIAAVGSVFYIAYVEQNEVHVRRIDPFDTTEPAPMVVKLSTVTPAGEGHLDPWITVSGPSQLAVTWSEPTSHADCSRDLQFRGFKDVAGQITPDPTTKLSTDAQKYHGYAPSSIACNNGTCVVASKVEYDTMANLYDCGEHPKGVVHAFPANAPTSLLPASGYNLALWTQFVVVGFVPGTSPWRLLRLYGKIGVTSLDLLSSSDGKLWGLPPVASFTGVANVRPSMVASDQDGMILAYASAGSTSPKPQIQLRYQGTQTASGSVPPLAGGGGTEPFLARETATDTPVVVFTRLDIKGDPDAIMVARIDFDETKPVFDGVDKPVNVSTSPGALSNNKPQKPVVAAGSHGFGVAWQEGDEVYFKWVGCLD